MTKKYLAIGISITVVVLLVLGSLSNVVGYQSVKSTTVNDSPLFSMRIQRATNPQQNILTSKYLGMEKGNELKIFFSNRNNNRILVQKALNRLHRMSDATFTKFVEQVLLWVSTQDEYSEVNVPQLINTLNLIKENPKTFEPYLVYDDNDLQESPVNTINRWYPGCLIFNVIKVFFLISILFYVVFFSSRLDTCVLYYTCDPMKCFPAQEPYDMGG